MHIIDSDDFTTHHHMDPSCVFFAVPTLDVHSGKKTPDLLLVMGLGCLLKSSMETVFVRTSSHARGYTSSPGRTILPIVHVGDRDDCL